MITFEKIIDSLSKSGLVNEWVEGTGRPDSNDYNDSFIVVGFSNTNAITPQSWIRFYFQDERTANEVELILSLIKVKDYKILNGYSIPVREVGVEYFGSSILESLVGYIKR